ncbi:MAG: TrkH family potassium uptake protein [Deltaproteobacteria bacterium]|nr:TrkH family potassium uptake protein [Deltaproteobacteria bacterium]
MSFALIFRIQGFLLLFISVCMGIPAIVALLYSEPAWQSFVYSILAMLLAGTCLILMCPSTEKQLSHREGFMVVSLGWIMAALFGSLPFVFEGTFSCFTDAYFETVSGFTTTGATVLGSIETQPRSILFWRSMIQWLGGMGIILFSIAILPLLGIGGMQLYKAEVPGPVLEKIKPRIAETARSLWKVYILLSAGEVLLLMCCGMDLFDAVCHTFTTMATGGFSTRDKSIESFQNPYVELVLIVFMIAAGINFTLHYRLFHGKFKSMLQDCEFRFYCAMLLGGTVLLGLAVYPGSGQDLMTTIRLTAFQAVSIMTTTGFSTCNFDTWPLFAAYILLILMFVGGCAGSTGGGIKCIRILLLIKRCYRELFYMVHPHAVASVKIGGKAIPENILRGLTGFVIVYVMIFIFGSLAMSLCGLDFITALSSVAATLGNIGPGLAGVGPYENFLFIPPAGKWILICLMLLGRLEIFTLLILFVPEFWKK